MELSLPAVIAGIPVHIRCWPWVFEAQNSIAAQVFHRIARADHVNGRPGSIRVIVAGDEAAIMGNVVPGVSEYAYLFQLIFAVATGFSHGMKNPEKEKFLELQYAGGC